MQPRTRKAFVSVVLLGYLTAYATAAGLLGAALVPRLPGWAELLFFAAAGIVWIFPLRPLFMWMNRR
jgi:hypothetical protein